MSRRVPLQCRLAVPLPCKHMLTDAAPIPGYGAETLAEVLPSAAALLRAGDDPLGLTGRVGSARAVVVYLIDGLGASMLDEFADVAPTMSRLSKAAESMTIRTCIPSTTAASITSLGTGRAPGEHGMVGYSVFLAEIDCVVNLIHFTKYGRTKEGTIADRVVPEVIQPHEPVLSRVRHDGIATFSVSPDHFEGTPLTRAALRGPDFVGWKDPGDGIDLVAAVAAEPDGASAQESSRCRLVYTYFSQLDFFGHIHGRGSAEFCTQLSLVDGLVDRLARELPGDCVLLITGDHGLVNIAESAKVDFDSDAELSEGVRALSGEPRFRHVHALPGDDARVLDVWRSRLGDDAWVLTRDEAIRAGWFGPRVESRVAGMIGDVVVAFASPMGVFQRRVDPLQARLVGHHGSFTPDESEIPLLVTRGAA